MDGARLFNAEVATGVDAARFAAPVTTVMSCLSKGLCAPVGSVLAGPVDVMDEARVERLRLGGAMRQAGVIAAAGLVALRTMVERLAEDHARARRLAEAVADRWPDGGLRPRAGSPPTWSSSPTPTPTRVVDHLHGEGILAGTIAPGVRAPRHPPRRRRRRPRAGHEGAGRRPLSHRRPRSDQGSRSGRLDGGLQPILRQEATPVATNIETLLGDEAESLLTHTCKGVTADELTLPGPDYIDRVFVDTDRPIPVVRNLATVYDHGRLGGTGYLSILPVDQGIEHSAAASFAKNPAYFDPANLVRAGPGRGAARPSPPPSAASGIVARRYAHKIPFIVKLNHNDFLHYPTTYDQVMFGSVRQAADLGAVGVGATIYFGSEQSDRQIQEVRDRLRRGPRARDCSPSCGATCATPASRPRRPTTTSSADLTGQANHIGVTIEADIIKQKQPENNGGLHTRSSSARPTRSSTSSSPPTTPST